MGMGNAISHFKTLWDKLNKFKTAREARGYLIDGLNVYKEERITVADQMIVELGLEKIKDGDVILTYCRCVRF